MADLTALGLQFKTTGGEQMLSTLDGVASKAKGAEAGVEGVAAASEKASASFGQAASGANAASSAFGAFAAKMREYKQVFLDAVQAGKTAALSERDAAAAAAAGAAALNVSTKANKDHADAANLNRMQVGELTHVFRSFVDGMAAGISPMRLMTMEGMRLYQAMSSGEDGLGGGFKALGSTLVKVLPLLAAVGAAAGAAFGIAALAARNLNQEHKNLLDGLGLDATQLDRLKEKHVETTVTIGDVWKGVWTYITDSFDKATKDQQKILSGWLDDAAHLVARFGAAAVGAFAAGFTIIATVWKELPNVIGEAITGAVNATLKGVQMMINGASDGINKLIQGANALDKAVLGSKGVTVQEFGHVDLGQFSNPNAGAGGQLRSDISGDIPAEAARKAVATYNSILTGMGNAVTKAAQDRIKSEAGDPAKQRKARQQHDPADKTDQRTAQVEQQVAQAAAQELQARLGLVKDLAERALIEKQINQADLQTRQAQIDRQIAQIQADKGLSDATKAKLTYQLEGVKNTQALTAIEKNQLSDRQRDAGLAKQAADTDQAARQSHIDLLTAQQGLAQSTAARWALDAKILAEQQEAEKADLQQQMKVASIQGDMAEVQKLQAHGQYLDQRQALERKALAEQQKVFALFDETESAFKSVGSAFADHDWARATNDLIDAIRLAVDDFKKAGGAAAKLQSVAGAISGIGNMIGGSVGGFLSGVGSGASAGAQIGGFFGPEGSIIGGIAGGLFGGISSLFGGNSKKKQEERDAQNQAAQAAAQAAQQAYEQHQQLELRLVEASGDALATLNAQRQQELQAASATDQALLKQIYDQEDRAKRQQTVNDVETEYLTLSGDKVGLLAAQRREENKSIDASLYSLVGLERTAEDAATALADAKTALQAAYDAEMQRLQDQLTAAQSAAADAQQTLSDLQSKRTQAHNDLVSAYNTEAASLQGVIDKFTDFGTSLRAFRASLDTSAAGLSPQNAYNAAASAFSTTSAKAQMGDQQALTDFQGQAQDFLTASAAYNGAASKQYQDDLAAVKTATEKAAATADRTVSNAQAQLNQLTKLVTGYIKLDNDVLSVDDAIRNLLDARQAARNAQIQVDATNNVVNSIQQQIAATKALVEPLLGINQGVMSLGQAIANYQAAQQANANAISQLAQAVTAAKANPNNSPAPAPTSTGPGYSSTNGDYAAYVQGNPDLLRLFQAQSGMAKGRTEAEFGVYHWANFGQYENRPVRPYARGGEFQVGGMGGTDSQHVQLMASPDEHITVKTPDQMNAEIENGARLASALEAAVARLDQLVTESKADKTQRGATHGQLVAKLGEVVEAVNGVKRTVRGQPQPQRRGRAA